MISNENAEKYTGNWSRKSPAIFLVEASGDNLSLKRHGGWRLTSVVEEYVADSILNKRKTTDNIIRGEPFYTEIHI